MNVYFNVQYYIIIPTFWPYKIEESQQKINLYLYNFILQYYDSSLMTGDSPEFNITYGKVWLETPYK